MKTETQEKLDEINSKLDKILSHCENLNLFPDTRCVNCGGSGKVPDYTSTSMNKICHICNGTGHR